MSLPRQHLQMRISVIALVVLLLTVACFASADGDLQKRVNELEARVKALEAQNAQLAQENADLKGPGHPGHIRDGMNVDDARKISGIGAEWRKCFHDNSVTSYELHYAQTYDVTPDDRTRMKDDLWGIVTTFNKNHTVRSVIRAITNDQPTE